MCCGAECLWIYASGRGIPEYPGVIGGGALAIKAKWPSCQLGLQGRRRCGPAGTLYFVCFNSCFV